MCGDQRRAGGGEARDGLEVGVDRAESCGPPSRMYGSAPKIGTSSQISATTRKLSRGRHRGALLVAGDLVEREPGAGR